MPRDLFGDVTHPSISLGSRKWYTVPLSLAAHVSVIVSVVLVSVLAHELVPTPREIVTFVAAPDLPDPPLPPKPVTIDKVPPPNPDAAPTVAPEGIAPEPDVPPAPPHDPVGTIDPGVIPGSAEAVTSGVLVAPPPAPEMKPVRPGGKIKWPTKIRDASPIYPTIAQLSRVQGTVVLEAIIGVDGKVANVRVLRGYPLLDQAALDAVRQWEYTPSELNGVPVPVIMTVTVTFTLNRDENEELRTKNEERRT